MTSTDCALLTPGRFSICSASSKHSLLQPRTHNYICSSASVLLEGGHLRSNLGLMLLQDGMEMVGVC